MISAFPESPRKDRVGNCGCDTLVGSYERLATLYHDLLDQDDLDQLLRRAADAVVDLVPCSSLVIAEVDLERQVIVPLVARGSWQEETLQMRPRIGEGLIGWAVAHARPVLSNDAHLDPRADHVEGTPDGDPEAIVCLPLVSRGAVLGALSLYREGEASRFSDDEFAMAQRFADAVTLAFVNAKTRHQLADLARTDYLTGVLNRRGFHEELTRVRAVAKQTQRRVVLLALDLDDFKGVNDGFGHTAGDLLLQQVAERLRTEVPAGGVVARLGGDEFGVLFVTDEQAEIDAAAKAVERAIGSLTFLHRGNVITLTASVGVGSFDGDDEADDAKLLALADESMYRRKFAGSEPSSLGERRARRGRH